MSVDLIRRIIADPHQFTRFETDSVGTVETYQLDNAPVFASTVSVYVGGSALVLGTDYSINPTTGLITFVSAPAIDDPIVVTYEHALLSDEDILAFLELNDGNVRRAAADALDTIASSESLIQKRITILDLKTEGDAVAKSLREHAKRLRDAEMDATEEDDDLFDYAEMALGPFNRHKIWWKEHGRDI